MNLRRIVPVAVLAMVAVVIVLATMGKRPAQREEAAAIKQKESVVAQNNQTGHDPAIQVASVRRRGTTARSRGVYRRTVAPTTQVASGQPRGSTTRSRGVYHGNVATVAVTSPRQGGMKIPGSSVGLWPTH